MITRIFFNPTKYPDLSRPGKQGGHAGLRLSYILSYEKSPRTSDAQHLREQGSQAMRFLMH